MLRGQSAQTIIKRPVFPRHVMFSSLLIINTSLAARRTRTRVIGAMIPQERELEEIRVYSFSNYPFFIMEGIGYVSFLGKARRFLISPRSYLNPPLV
jgi:hypothetical protein